MSKTLEVYSKEVEKINTRMYRKRLDPNYNFFAHGWTMYSMREIRPMKPRDKIKSLLTQGYKVSSGYFCTSVRGFHEYYIMFKYNPLTPRRVHPSGISA